MLALALDPGTTAALVALALGAVSAIALYRNLGRGAGTALTTVVEANRILEARVVELEHLRSEDTATIAELRGRTDVTLALAPILDWSTHHESRAQARHEAMLEAMGTTARQQLAVLDLIAKRLGPDPNGPRRRTDPR